MRTSLIKTILVLKSQKQVLSKMKKGDPITDPLYFFNHHKQRNHPSRRRLNRHAAPIPSLCNTRF